MDDVLIAALAPALADLRAADIPPPRFEDADWTDDPAFCSAMMWSPDGSGRGVSVDRRQPLHEQIAGVADQLQEWVIEELQPVSRTNWPPCPRHPTTHPLAAVAADGTARWRCPADDVDLFSIGQLVP